MPLPLVHDTCVHGEDLSPGWVPLALCCAWGRTHLQMCSDLFHTKTKDVLYSLLST